MKTFPIPIHRAALAAVIFTPAIYAAGEGSSLRFRGSGSGDIDRVKIQIDDPATAAPGPPADVGASDFTIEFWMKASAAENRAAAVSCGANINWIYGNIVLDRDRLRAFPKTPSVGLRPSERPPGKEGRRCLINGAIRRGGPTPNGGLAAGRIQEGVLGKAPGQDRKFGISIAGGVIVFGVTGDGTGSRTICGAANVLDGRWHHVAVQRRSSDGRLWLHVDGRLEREADGPDGDVSYPDGGVPGNFCGGPCDWSDPYLVIGAEKHDAGAAYPSYSGWLDELRLSTALRYPAGGFEPLAAPFEPDAAAAALYHFDEGTGDAVRDASGHPAGPSDGIRRFGGSPPGPEWSAETPFAPAAAPAGFIRGDANCDGAVDIADAVRILLIAFLGAPAACCPATADADGSHSSVEGGNANAGAAAPEPADAVYLLEHLFLHGPPPPAPYPACGATGCPPHPCSRGVQR